MRKTSVVLMFLASALLTAQAAGGASLIGSRESLERQKEMADRLGLPIIQDDHSLDSMKVSGKLVPIPASDALRVDPRLEPKWHWLHPEAAEFLKSLATESLEKFKVPLQVNSAVRTIQRQVELQRTNRNATVNEFASHARGMTFDLARFKLVGKRRVWYPTQHQRWLEGRLLEFERRGLVEVTRERIQAVFHVTVFGSQIPEKPAEKPPMPPEERYPVAGITPALRGYVCMFPSR